jgi:hypothetical protein
MSSNRYVNQQFKKDIPRWTSSNLVEPELMSLEFLTISSQSKQADAGSEIMPHESPESSGAVKSPARLSETEQQPRPLPDNSLPSVEQLDIIEPDQPEDHIYPTGIKVYLAVGALYTAFFLNGLVSKVFRNLVRD